ncbi:MAG: isoprenylcysteine carboxylmethyltransferase family protein [Gammaproteobacteria bacterium]|nr:isoprenylcysteine carboxylmethyltransferase family protein [Gammaproteobacteria bacterium]
MHLSRKIIPPVYLLASLILMFILDRYFPVLKVITSPFHYSGILVGIFGLVLAANGVFSFKRAGTAIKPFETSTVLVTDGVYRYTRNPMYLGLVILLVGVASYLGSLTPYVVIPVFFLIIQQCFIKHEEPFLENIFGQDYLDYKTKVRRWL